MPGNPITIRNLGPEDAHVLDRVREGTFDNPIDPTLAWGFLATRVNEIVVALDQGEVIGFVSGTVIMHPDKPTQFFVNELGVHEDYRRQGIATRLMRRIGELAGDRGCEALWLATEIDNDVARSFYESIDAEETDNAIVYSIPT
ncbi:MAG: GNAT family N-acetyltransferase [Boseongicola sp.]|nr:GNAT family N-acetyltransferase [Boseongicola sp.]MDD9976154.1 GNAT family N-acetyltransferase [Boseongicola sp.]